MPLMNIMNRIRIYHALLAVLAVTSYLTGEMGVIHSWLGYGVAFVVTVRLLWALSGERQVGLMRFYPTFAGLQANNFLTHPAISRTLMLGIAVCLLGVTATGLALDKGKTIGLTSIAVVSPANADDDETADRKREGEGMIEESHEFFANAMLFFVGMHVSYLLLFKRPLAKFMLFIPKRA